MWTRTMLVVFILLVFSSPSLYLSVTSSSFNWVLSNYTSFCRMGKLIIVSLLRWWERAMLVEWEGEPWGTACMWILVNSWSPLRPSFYQRILLSRCLVPSEVQRGSSAFTDWLVDLVPVPQKKLFKFSQWY
jgi:hypothetical protein